MAEIGGDIRAPTAGNIGGLQHAMLLIPRPRWNGTPGGVAFKPDLGV